MTRVVSLIASSTELVVALGCQSMLVGRSHECDYPGSVKDLPCCTTPRIQIGGSSGEIDQEVRSLIEESLSIYQVDVDLLRELRPDLILTQDHCRVCAVSLPDVECALREILEYSPTVISLHPDRLKNIWEDFEIVGSALGVTERAISFQEECITHLERLRSRAPTSETKPKVALLEWLEPIMGSSNWLPELVEIAGGLDVTGRVGTLAPKLSITDLSQADPDLIVLSPCGFDVTRTALELPTLTRRADWRQLRAVREGRVFIVDGNQYLNRPGPRIVESVEILQEILFPEYVPPLHRGAAWVRVENRL